MAEPLSLPTFRPIDSFRDAVRKGRPWDSIVDFVSHPSFCGQRLYPRQMTLLKLIYLETETFTDYDLTVIDEWAQGFKNRAHPIGVQPDIMDRIKLLKSLGYTHFPHVQMVLGRRASKGILGGLVTAERIAYLYSLGSWQQYYNQVPGQVAEIQVVAPSLNLAVTRQFKDIRNAVMGCAYLREHIVGDKITEFFIRTPGDEQTIIENKLAGVDSDREIATIVCKAATAASTSGRGGTGFVNCYDEYAHMLTGTGSSKTGEEIYDAFQPALDQFGKDAMTYLASSPYSKIGKFYELYQQGSVTLPEYNAREGKLETQSFADRAAAQDIDDDDGGAVSVAEPTFLIVQLPSWELYRDWDRSNQIPMRPGKRRAFARWTGPVQYRPDPKGSPDERLQERRRLRNPDKFKVERGGQFATVQDAYLDENKVDQMFLPPGWRDPLVPQDRGRFSIAYRAHADPSRTNANFGFCIAHLEDAPPDEHGYIWPHVIIDVLKVWKPEDFPEHTLDYVQVTEELDAYLTRFPTIKKMSYDQFNSAGLISHQKRSFPNIRILQQTFTEQQNQDRFEKFKSALNLGWVHSYRDDFAEDGQSLLELELKFLQEKISGSKIKVDKQDIGPVQTKDLADCVMVVVTDLLHDSLDRWYKSLNRVVGGSTNVAGLKSGRETERHAIYQAHVDEHRPSTAHMDPMQRYFADQMAREERRAERAAHNRAVLERNKTERMRRNFGYGATPTSRTRGRFS
ncbi:terminase [Mycobacterium phage Tonenili]|uniref:Terminase n=1 Tax=Mycobacterium phage Tonenili TaxID=1891703 RepID=A0A1C9EHL4_9CAUD|nr:terminase [Mycobacterium phage Tonenili]AON96993.1 terminase [Mycobacterium phage Tonenili]